MIYCVNVPLKASLIQCTFRLTNYVVITLRGVVVFIVLFEIWFCADNLIFWSSTTHVYFWTVTLSLETFYRIIFRPKASKHLVLRLIIVVIPFWCLRKLTPSQRILLPSWRVLVEWMWQGEAGAWYRGEDQGLPEYISEYQQSAIGHSNTPRSVGTVWKLLYLVLEINEWNVECTQIIQINLFPFVLLSFTLIDHQLDSTVIHFIFQTLLFLRT